MLARTRPGYACSAALEIHGDIAVEQVLPPPDRHRSAGSGSAGLRLSGTALEDAQANMAAVDDLHEADVGTFRKSWMAFDRRSQARDGRRIDIRDAQHDMRIAHGHGPELDRAGIEVQGVRQRLAARLHRQGARLEI